MKKRAAVWLIGLLATITAWFLRRSLADDKDWSIGCFKEDPNNRYFQVSPGNYVRDPNLPGAACVQACSALNGGFIRAGVTADGVCLCSSFNVRPSHTVNNTLCLYPRSNGVFFVVYPIAPLANISIPESVLVFQEFSLHVISVGDPSCEYLLDFNDGSRVTINTTINNSVTHVYKSEGIFTVKLSSEPTCLPDVVTANVEVKLPFTNASLECPTVIEKTDTNSSCSLSVLRGAEINVTMDSTFLGTMSDTFVGILGITSSFFKKAPWLDPSSELEGTYLLPLATASHDGIMSALEVYVNRSGSLVIQIYTPKCPTDQVACFGDCVASDVPCGGPSVSGCSLGQEMCLALGTCNSSTRCLNSTWTSQINITSVDYVVRVEFEVRIVSAGYAFVKVSPPIRIQRGDVLGWYASSSGAGIEFSYSSSSSELFYPNQKFAVGQNLLRTVNRPNKAHHLRVYWFATSVFEIGLTPKMPRIVVFVNVSSMLYGQHQLLLRNISVQERISHLQIVSPNMSKYYPTNSDIEFSFEVAKGSDVCYHVDLGNGSNLSSCDTGRWTHSYQQRGNYTFRVIASNQINNVSAKGYIMLVNDIKNLSFKRDPKNVPGEVGVPYTVKFQLDVGDGVIFLIDTGKNLFQFTDCGNSTNKEISTNFNYTKAGTYNITVVALSRYLHTNLTIYSSVQIMERIQNLTLWRVKDGQDELLGKELHIYHQSLKIRAKIATGTSVTFIFTKPGKVTSRSEAIYQFKSGGDWEIQVIAKNEISQLNQTLRVNVAGACENSMSILDKRPENDALRTTRGYDLTLKFEQIHSTDNRTCHRPPPSCWTFNWTLFKKNNKYEKINSSSQKILFIAKRTLDIGLYKVTMEAFCNDSELSSNTSVSETYFEIKSTNPVALISGGERRDVAYNLTGELTLDAGSSYDPDGTHFNSSGLSFYWTSNSSLDFQGNESPSIKVNRSQLNLRKEYVFQVRVSTSDNRSDVARQKIYVVGEHVPTTEIKCKVNCLPVVLVTERLSLEGYCLTCLQTDGIIFSWDLEERESNTWKHRSLREEVDTFTGLKKANIVIKPDVLEHDKIYRLLLKARRSSSTNESLSIYAFNTSSVPRGGQCFINPKTGISAETSFYVLCEGWNSDNIPLTYSIRYQSSFTQNVNVSSVGRVDKIWILWYQGQEQSSPRRILPSGTSENDYNLSILIRIQDKYGAYASSNLSVQVKPKNLTEETFEKALSDLKEVDVKSNPQKIPQLVTTFSIILNQGIAKNDVEEAKKLRNDLVKQLSRVPANTLPLIKQTADAVKLATYTPEQVSFETQKVAADTLKRMSEALVNIASDSGQKNGQTIDETAKILVSSLSKIMDASAISGHDITETSAPKAVKKNLYGTLSKEGARLEQIRKETEEVNRDNLRIIDDVSFAILKKKLIGEDATYTNTTNFVMRLSNNLPEDVAESINAILSDSEGFRLPSHEIVFRTSSFAYKIHQVFTKLITFNDNPYSWDIERSPFIQPRVLSLSLITDKRQSIRVHDLSKDIEVFLPNEEQAIPSPLEVSKDDPKLLVHNFKVDKSHFNKTLLLSIGRGNDSISGAKFFIRFGKQVSQSYYYFSQLLPSNCQSCNGHSINITNSTFLIHEPKKLEESSGEVSIGISLCVSDEISPESCDSSAVGYNAHVVSVSCRFWNKSLWMENGCKVGRKTTRRKTHCLCNHLTSFGSYIVKPNPLTKFSIEDFSNGYVMFVAVVVIFLLYFLILVWARKADCADFAKIGIYVLPDNNPQDMYRYEISVWTGLRRNAGTGSKVTVILSGDILDTEPRRLVNPNAKGFQRGSLEKFLLTTPRDIGSLYCIRIMHDNSKGSWYLSRVMVTDLEKDQRYYFICDRWLAVDEDDGAIERLLPVASEEELVEFQRLFLSRTKRNLSDSHLWISVLNRPPQSHFTRVQRLSCCLCLLLMSMVTNAMFYGRRSEPTADSTNFIGSYSFTWDEVYIGVASSLIVFPVNVIILYIFRNVRPKPVKPRHQSEIALNRLSPDFANLPADPLLTSSSATFVTTASSSEEANIYHTKYPQVIEKTTNKKKGQEKTHWSKFKDHLPRLPSSLPHWFVYVAWLLLVTFTLGSAIVVILYGLQFGNGRSLQWLLSNVISICEDIFLIQPLKVLALALAFALLVKKPDEGEFRVSGDEILKDNEKLLVNPPSDSGSEEKSGGTSSKLPLRPDVSQLRLMRKARLKERKMLGLVNEIIVHLLFTITIALITYGHKDIRSIYLFQHLDQLNATTDEITNFSDVWDWSRNVLIPMALPETLYNSRDVPLYGFMDDRYNNLLSSARMRLLRVKNDSCTVSDKLKRISDHCAQDYSMYDQDEACYGKRWNKTSNALKDKKTPWCFQSWRKLDGYPYWGRFTTYSGSGYVVELSPGDTNNDTTNNMQALDWLEKHSRALFVELTVYNANVNLFASILLLFEFPSFGGVFYSREIQPMRLKMYVGGFAFFIFACEVVFVLFIVAYLYVTLKKLYHNGVAYFKTFWNSIDFAIVTVSLAAIGVYIYRIEMTTALMRRVRDREGDFVNFQYTTYWNEVFNGVVAVIVCLTTIKLTKLMRFNLRISLFGMTLKRARPALVMFGVQFGIVFFAYVMVGCLVFGQSVAGFKSILWGIMSLGRVILGKSQFLAELSNINRVIGPLFFFTFVLFVSWILITMFMAILDDAYHRVKLQCGSTPNEYEMVDFFLARFRAWFGLGRAKGVSLRVPPPARWEKARLKVKAVNWLGHRHLYQQSAEDIAVEKTGDLMEKLEDSILNLEKRVYLLYALDGED